MTKKRRHFPKSCISFSGWIGLLKTWQGENDGYSVEKLMPFDEIDKSAKNGRWIANKSAKFRAKRLNRSKKIFQLLLFSETLCRLYIIKNSSADEIGERYVEIPITAWTIPQLWNFTTPILNFPVTFSYLIRASYLFRRIVTFWLLRFINTLTYLFT